MVNVDEKKKSPATNPVSMVRNNYICIIVVFCSVLARGSNYFVPHCVSAFFTAFFKISVINNNNNNNNNIENKTPIITINGSEHLWCELIHCFEALLNLFRNGKMVLPLPLCLGGRLEPSRGPPFKYA